MIISRADIVPFLKFGTIGAVNTVLHSGIVLLAHGSMGIPVMAAHVVAFVMVNAFSYFTNGFLVFKKPPSFPSYVCFVAVSLVSLISTLVIAGICELLALDYRIGLVAVIAISPPLTYVLQKSFTFRLT